ncbi:MAG: hypothetical protein LAO04_03695 [Acidobacteriia bacterium]|nr:hypothetical protein [Terriglobia bacterium]
MRIQTYKLFIFINISRSTCRGLSPSFVFIEISGSTFIFNIFFFCAVPAELQTE